MGILPHYLPDGPNKYWVKDGKCIRKPNQEGFAEYYGRIMVPAGISRDAGLESIEMYLPGSKEHMDEIFNEMSER